MNERLEPIVVVGAGAAGLLAAIFASGGKRPVLVLESTVDGGRKILVSGGGRCNILPVVFSARDFHTESSPHLLRNILRSWPAEAQRAFFEEELGLPLVNEPETGKLFPQSQSAREVRDRLIGRARRDGVSFRFGVPVRGLEPPDGEGASWTIRLAGGETLGAAAVILATGGLSVPKTGSDGTGLGLAAGLGHTLHDTYPALTPLTLDPPRFASLAGVSCTATLTTSVNGKPLTARGGFLFTHRGYSGPAVLDVSHAAVRSLASGEPAAIHVRWTDLEAEAWDAELRSGAGAVGALVRKHLPQRLAEALLQEAGIAPDQPRARLAAADRRRLVTVLTRFPLPWTGSEGYKTAEVTGGGIALGEVDPRTLESRRRPGLFLCGEMLDAFGPIGGYNFAWAWATGRLAGRGARDR